MSSKAAECCRLLTERGADVTFADSLGRTALFYAILNGHADAVGHMLQCNPRLGASATTISPLLVAIGAHWLHPDINDIHSLSGVKISADVVQAILYNIDHDAVSREELLSVIDILEVKEKGCDLIYASIPDPLNNEAAVRKDFKEKHWQIWKANSTLVRDEQIQRLKTSIIAHGAFMRSEPNGIGELHRAKKHVQNYLFFKSCRDLIRRTREMQGKNQEYFDYLKQQASSTLAERGNVFMLQSNRQIFLRNKNNNNVAKKK